MVHRIAPEKMAVYRAAAQRRRQERAARVGERRELAWRVAREGARLLEERYGAQRVVAFGSLLSAERFHERSDVDLAAWGLPEAGYYRAVGQLLGLDPAIPIDLVRVETAPPGLLAAIDLEGVEL